MKELSIEEKAKLYDKAIERAKYYQKENGSAVISAIFPELKECEDEKIRKALIEAIRNNYTLTGYINHIPTKDILAWLEKQGEHANFRNEIQVGDKVTRNEDGVLVNLSQLKRVAKKDEKQGEQKSIDDLTPQEAMNIAVAKCFEQGEQKPTDKFEPKFKVGDKIIEKDFDECCCGTIIDIKDGKYIFDNGGFICIEEQGLWQLVEQKPAWSEEDERCLTNAIDACKQMSDEDYDYSQSYIDAINWLKSLKERYTWKPTMEQLTVLNNAIELRPLYESDGTILMSLYYDLKKLKG